jgi:hypothetical protein
LPLDRCLWEASTSAHLAEFSDLFESQHPPTILIFGDPFCDRYFKKRAGRQ